MDREATQLNGVTASTAAPTARQPARMMQPPMLYQREYIALVLFSTLDILGTWIILVLGGSEVNPIADAVLQYWDISGVVAFKYAIVTFVIIICESVGRQRRHTGRRLARVCVAIAAAPVAVAITLLLLAA